ncbi:MAG: DUF2169 domain-containing protein [Minicystis sp.]
MNILNATKLVPFSFETRDRDGDPAQVVVVKGTFDLVPGQPLALAEEQDPVRLSDEPESPDAPSSLRHEDDLAPWKPRSDILVRATAHAPSGRPEREWLAGVAVGSVAKRVRVTGPRFWARAFGFSLGPPEPTLAVPIRYEGAYGGRTQQGDTVIAHEENPVGKGLFPRRDIESATVLPAPVILPPDGREPSLSSSLSVEGFSPMAKSWLPRRARAGTFDHAWLARRHPDVPEDFSYGFYNCAHPDLTYPGYLRGDEPVRLERLVKGHEIVTFSLPGFIVGVALLDRAGHRHGTAAKLDTLSIDAERMRVSLVWRARLPIFNDGVRRVDVAMRRSLSPEKGAQGGR